MLKISKQAGVPSNVKLFPHKISLFSIVKPLSLLLFKSIQNKDRIAGLPLAALPTPLHLVQNEQ